MTNYTDMPKTLLPLYNPSWGFDLTVFLLDDVDRVKWLCDEYISMIESHPGVGTGGSGPTPLEHYVSGPGVNARVRTEIINWCDSHPAVASVTAGPLSEEAP